MPKGIWGDRSLLDGEDARNPHSLLPEESGGRTAGDQPRPTFQPSG